MSTPPLLLALAWGAWRVGAPVAVYVVLLALALFLGVVALFDFPMAIEFGENGVERMSLLRKHLIPWDEIDRIGRTRQKGLIVVTKRGKRHILLDRRLEEGELRLIKGQASKNGVDIGS